MTAKPLTFRLLATQDVEDIAEYYSQEAGQDVALRFADALQAASDIVSQRPATGSQRLGDVLGVPGLRSRTLRHFPYLIVYIERPGDIEIWRILHTARDVPASLREA